MAKKKSKREQVRGVVETALEFGTVCVNGRTINVWDDKVLTNPQRNMVKKKKNPLEVELVLNEKIVKLPQNYTLSNLPVYNEEKYMQQYHFVFTTEQSVIQSDGSLLIPRIESGVYYLSTLISVGITPGTDYQVFVYAYKNGQSKEVYKNDITLISSFAPYVVMSMDSPYGDFVGRGTDVKMVEEVFVNSKVIIERPEAITIGDSITNTEYIVSYRSTVLSEAIINGFNAVIDDVTQDIGVLERVMDPNVKRTSLRLSQLIDKYLNKWDRQA